MERTAFDRAKSFLNYRSRAKWLAILSGCCAGIFYVLLVLLLALYVDLLVSHGRVPNFAQLSVPEQDHFIDSWKKLSEQDRLKCLRDIGLREHDEVSVANVSPRPNYNLWQSLTDTENIVAVPGRLTAENLSDWSRDRRYADNPPYVQAMIEQELRWRAYVREYLNEHVGSQAANSYLPTAAPGEELPIPGIGEENRTPHGVLGLVVRLRGTTAGRMLAGVASFNPWMWEGSQNKDANRLFLTGLLLLGIFAALMRSACVILMNLQAARATVEAVTRMRRAVYHHASRLGDQSVHSNGGSVEGLFTRQIEAVHEALFNWLTTNSRYPTQVFLLVLLALAIQPWLTLAIVLFALLVWLMGGQIVAAFRREERSSSRIAANRLVLLLESIRLMKLVKSYLMDLFNQSRVERQLADYSKAHLRRYRGEGLGKPVLVLLMTLSAITLFYLAGRIILNDALSLAGLTVLAVAVTGLYVPMHSWLELKKHTRRGRTAAALVFEYLDQRGAQVQFADAEFLQPLSKALEFRNVRYRSTESNRDLLHDVNFVIRAGEKISIMGADDNEKQALLNLIPRFADPTEGEIKVDGRNLRWVTLESLRSQIGVVMRNQLIFNDTIANNIGCGDPSITLPQIIEAAKLAHAHQFIQKLPYGYETPIGEMGQSLRIGEQFRIALARAILRDPVIYIIEEPREPLDDDSKSLLDDTFHRILAGKTVVFLPHRISTLRRCDRVILLHDGRVEAIGEHRELIHSNSLYKHIYYVEFNAFAEQV